MEILSHFRTIEELTKTLSREQGLLSEMFEKRKLMKFPLGVALELVGVLKTEDIHPPKTGISVHFSGSLV